MPAARSSRDFSTGAGHALPASTVARCASVEPGRRTKWVTREPPLVRGGPLFTAHDAVETAIVDSLAQANQKVGPPTWLAVRQPVRELIMAGTDDIWIVMGASGFAHAAVHGAAAAAEFAAKRTEACHIISVGDRIAEARRRFDVALQTFKSQQTGKRERQIGGQGGR